MSGRAHLEEDRVRAAPHGAGGLARGRGQRALERRDDGCDLGVGERHGVEERYFRRADASAVDRDAGENIHFATLARGGRAKTRARARGSLALAERDRWSRGAAGAAPNEELNTCNVARSPHEREAQAKPGCARADGGRVSGSAFGAVIHRNLSVIACDTPATLQETLHRIDDLAIDVVALGERHFVLPASQAPRVLERLREHGQFPRLVGEPVRTVSEEEDVT